MTDRATREPKAKRKKAAATTQQQTHIPVELTLEPGESYASGAFEAVPDQPLTAFAVERHVLPPRERQNALTLQPADQPPRAMVELMQLNNLWHVLPPEDALRVVAADDLFADALTLQRHAFASAGDDHAGAGAADGDGDSDALMTDADADAPTHTNAVHTGSRRLPRLITASEGPLTLTPAQQAQHFNTRGLTSLATARVPADLNVKRNAIERLADAVEQDRQVRWVRQWEQDREFDSELPFERRPMDYPGFAQLDAQYRTRFETRHEHNRQLTAAYPRPSIVELTREYIANYRVRPRPELQERPCCNGRRGTCLFDVIARKRGTPNMGYVAREFYIPSEQAAWDRRRAARHPVSDAMDGPARECIDCLLFRWAWRAHQNASLKFAPTEVFNTFTVAVKEGQYAPEAMLPRGFGIEGHVPAYTTNARHYEMRERVAPNSNGTRVSEPYLAEVGQVFWRSLSEANACLGARKSEPILGPDVPRFVVPNAAVYLPRRGLERTAQGSDWIQFVRSAATGVLVDRVLLVYPTEQATQVPTAWLRRSLSLPFPEPAQHVRAPAPLHATTALLARALREQSTALQERELAALLQCPLSELPGELATLADMAFCSYERAVACWLHLGASRLQEGLVTGPLLALFAENDGDEMAGVPCPAAIEAHIRAVPRGAQPSADYCHCLLGLITGDAAASWVLWAVALWRCAVAVLFERYVRPWPRGAAHAAVETWVLNALGFRDTHNELFAYMAMAMAMAVQPAWSDQALLADHGRILAAYYPQANRVCCAGELPTLAGGPIMALNAWFDKAQTSLLLFILFSYCVYYVNTILA